MSGLPLSMSQLMVLMVEVFSKRVAPGAYRSKPSRYTPHQGERECERRRRKTHTVDRPVMAKADRQMKSAVGIRSASRKIRSRGFPKRARIEAETDMDT